MAESVPFASQTLQFLSAEFPALCAYVDRDLRYRFANPAYGARYGRASGDVVGAYVADVLGPDQFPRAYPWIKRTLAGERVRFELDFADGAVEVEYVPDADHGDVRGYVVIAHDLNRQNADEFVGNRASDLLIETIPQGIWRSDATGAAEYCSRRFCEIVGYDEAQMLGWGWAGLIHPEDRARVLVEWQAARDAGGAISIEFRVRTADGGYRWFISLGNPLKDPRGNILKYYGTWTDIDENKRMAIENTNLLRREREALRARDEFLSAASHELKTPLTSLKLQSQLLRHLRDRGDARAYRPERVDDLITQVDRQVNRLNRLVDDMLDISRIQAGRLIIEPRLTDLIPLVRDTCVRMRDRLSVDMPVLVTVPETGSLRVAADPERMAQVLESLLSNALRFGERRPVSVTLTERDGSALLAVRDQGRGIPANLQTRIFERFGYADSPQVLGGLGLGLFIAREIVGRHDGEIWVESQPERGATFYVRLPLA